MYGCFQTRSMMKTSFYAFEMLYWCGIREGELLALTAADFDFEKETVRINKSYQESFVENRFIARYCCESRK